MRPGLREIRLTHLLTAIGISLIALVLAAGPLGRPGQAAQAPQRLVASAHTDLGTEPPSRPNDSVSSRGDRLPAVTQQLRTPGSDSSPARAAADPTPGATAQTLAAAATGSTSTPSNRTASPAATPSPAAATQPTPIPSSPAPGASRSLRVGIQAGHWKCNELPAELASLRRSTGAAGSGWKEVDVNLDVAKRVQALLTDKGIQVDLIPSTVPTAYKADAFVAIHGDANSNTSVSGYKLARATRSTNKEKDDALLAAISDEYAAATGLKNHPSSITANMTSYYAFANQGIAHSVAPTTPAVILEMGFLTTASDRQLLLQEPQKAAEGIAKGILKFLGVD